MTDEPKKPTRAELTARKIRMARAMIDQRAHPSDIKRAFAQKFGSTPRAAERFITKAYEQIREETGRPIEEHRQEANAFYRGVVADTKVPIRDRIRAQENIDKILGLNAPIKVASTDSEGKDLQRRPVTPEEADQELDRLLGGDPPAIPNP